MPLKVVELEYNHGNDHAPGRGAAMNRHVYIAFTCIIGWSALVRSAGAVDYSTLMSVPTVYAAQHGDLTVGGTAVDSFYLQSYGNSLSSSVPTYDDGAAGLFVKKSDPCAEDNATVIKNIPSGACYFRQNVNGDTRQFGLIVGSAYAFDINTNPTPADATSKLHDAFVAAQKAGLTGIHTSGMSLFVATLGDLAILKNMSLSCDSSPGVKQTDADYRKVPGTLWTGHGHTITTDPSLGAPGTGTVFRNCAVLPQWYANPSLASAFSGVTTLNFGAGQKYADLDAIRKNMILASDTGYSCTQDSTKLNDLLILGFDNAVALLGCPRLNLKNVWVDANVGLFANGGGGQTDLENADVEPFLTKQPSADNEEYWNIASISQGPVYGGVHECELHLTHGVKTGTTTPTSWDTHDLRVSDLDAQNNPISYPVWVTNLQSTPLSGNRFHGCNGRYAVQVVNATGMGSGSTATLDLLGSNYDGVSITGQWNANSNLIYVRTGYANLSPGQSVTIAGATYIVAGLLPRTKGPDPNDSFAGGILVTPAIAANSDGGSGPSANLDDPGHDQALTFTNPTPDLSNTCDGAKRGGCLFLNAAERSFAGNSAAGIATGEIPASNGSHLAAGFYFDDMAGPRSVNSFTFSHNYGYVLKDTNSGVFTMETGDENGELDDPNQVFFATYGTSNETSVIGNKNGQSGSSIVADIYLPIDADHTGLHQTAGAVAGGVGATVSVSSTTGWPKAGTLDICSALDSNSNCDPGSPRELATYEVTGTSQFTLIARGQWGTAPQSFASGATVFNSQLSSFKGCVSYTSVSNPSTTSALNNAEALHGCLLLTNVRSSGPGVAFISHNAQPSRFVSAMMGDVSLYFEDAAAAALLDSTQSDFLTDSYLPPKTALLPPQGRLTCDSNRPVQTSDSTACATLYYLPYVGWSIPLSDGNGFRYYNIPATGISLPLDANSAHAGFQQSGNVYDIFIGIGTPGGLVIGTGPNWGGGTPSTTSRGAGAGTPELALLNGLWVNKYPVTVRFGTASNTVFSCPVNACVYLGTMYATAAGQTKVLLAPAGANGGTNNVVGLWNAYNRVRAVSTSTDTTSNWGCTSTCDGATWQPLDQQGTAGGLGNRVSVIDGLGLTAYDVLLTQANMNQGGTPFPKIGACIDSTTCAPVNPGQVGSTSRISVPFALSAFPKLGLHYVQAVQQTASSMAGSPYGTGATLTLEWEY